MNGGVERTNVRHYVEGCATRPQQYRRPHAEQSHTTFGNELLSGASCGKVGLPSGYLGLLPRRLGKGNL